MEFLQKNARAIILALLIIGVVSAVSNSGTDEDTDAVTEATTSSEVVAETTPDEDVTGAVEGEAGDDDAATPAMIEKTDSEYTVSAVSGDNQTKLVRRVIAQYVDEADVEISGEQRVYMETHLVNSLPRNDMIFVGDTIRVNSDEMMALVDSSQNLSDADLALWAAYL
jgi:hypothetical protein